MPSVSPLSIAHSHASRAQLLGGKLEVGGGSIGGGGGETGGGSIGGGGGGGTGGAGVISLPLTDEAIAKQISSKNDRYSCTSVRETTKHTSIKIAGALVLLRKLKLLRATAPLSR